MGECADEGILKEVRMWIELYLAAVNREFDQSVSCDLHLNGVHMGVDCKSGVARKAENLIRSIVHVIRDWWVMTNLFQEVVRSVGRLGLVSLTKDWVQRLVPVMRRLEVCDASSNYHLHPLYRICCHCSEVEKVGLHRPNC